MLAGNFLIIVGFAITLGLGPGPAGEVHAAGVAPAPVAPAQVAAAGIAAAENLKKQQNLEELLNQTMTALQSNGKTLDAFNSNMEPIRKLGETMDLLNQTIRRIEKLENDNKERLTLFKEEEDRHIRRILAQEHEPKPQPPHLKNTASTFSGPAGPIIIFAAAAAAFRG